MKIFLEVIFNDNEPFFEVNNEINQDNTITVTPDDISDSFNLPMDTMVDVRIFEHVKVDSFESFLKLLKAKNLYYPVNGDEPDALIQTFSDEPVSVVDFLDEHFTVFDEDLVSRINSLSFSKKKSEKKMKLSKVLDYFKQDEIRFGV